MQAKIFSQPQPITPKEAIEIQKQLATLVKIERPQHKINYAAGLDAAFSRDGKYCIAAAILWDIEKQQVIEQHISREPVHFPYIPGLLSFREAPALLKALEQLHHPPDAILCDGQGIAHPRHLGLACHIGILTDTTSLGCGKSRLVGEYIPPGQCRGDKSVLLYKDKIIGSVLRTKNNTKPLYISPGHKIDQQTAEEIVLSCCIGYRLPEPIRRADRLVAEIRQQ